MIRYPVPRVGDRDEHGLIRRAREVAPEVLKVCQARGTGGEKRLGARKLIPHRLKQIEIRDGKKKGWKGE